MFLLITVQCLSLFFIFFFFHNTPFLFYPFYCLLTLMFMLFSGLEMENSFPISGIGIYIFRCYFGIYFFQISFLVLNTFYFSDFNFGFDFFRLVSGFSIDFGFKRESKPVSYICCKSCIIIILL